MCLCVFVDVCVCVVLRMCVLGGMAFSVCLFFVRECVCVCV